jgi:predicted aldo/keto reductase-like oxidoreductase
MSQTNEMKRRHFLRNSALGIVGAGIIGSGQTAYPQETKTPPSEGAKIKAFRTLGRTGFKVSDISTGGPMNEGILNALLDAGVNYIDTAENYGRGKSETVTGEVTKNRDRKSLFITSKLGIKKDDTKESVLKRTRKCLERLQTDYIDCMMMHASPKVESLKSEAFHAAMKQLKNEGRVRFLGLSNHGSQWKDDVEPMEKVCLAAAADGRFDVMLFVYNFIQKDAGERVLKACKDKNIGATLMKTNPVGGYLRFKEYEDKLKKEGKEMPETYKKLIPRVKAKADKAGDFIKKYNLENPGEIRDAAIKYVLNHPAVNTVCISYNSFDDIEKYIKLSGSKFTALEEKKLAAYLEGCGELYCRHACGICELSCPHNVPINTIMRYNHYFEAQGREKHAMEKYAALTTAKPDKCWNCSGYCNAACPYGVPIQGLLTLAHQTLTLA